MTTDPVARVEVTVEATVIRADGTVEHLGVISLPNPQQPEDEED